MGKIDIPQTTRILAELILEQLYESVQKKFSENSRKKLRPFEVGIHRKPEVEVGIHRKPETSRQKRFNFVKIQKTRTKHSRNGVDNLSLPENLFYGSTMLCNSFLINLDAFHSSEDFFYKK